MTLFDGKPLVPEDIPETPAPDDDESCQCPACDGGGEIEIVTPCGGCDGSGQLTKGEYRSIYGREPVV